MWCVLVFRRVLFMVLAACSIVAMPSCSSDSGGSRDAGAADGAVTPDAGPNAGSWNLSGTIRGINLQNDVLSAVSSRIDDGTSIQTSVTLVNLENYCARSQENSSCVGQGVQHRLMEVTILGTATGTYPTTGGGHTRPPAGEAELLFVALGDSCQLLAPTLWANSGSVTFTEIDLNPGGQVSFSFDVSTSEGSVSGTVTAPFCK